MRHDPVEQPGRVLGEEEAGGAGAEDPQEAGTPDGAVVHRASTMS